MVELDNKLLTEDKVKQSTFDLREKTLKVKQEGYGPNVMKAMVLNKTAEIYKSLDINEMKVVNVGGGQGKSTQNMIAETMATYNALKA